MSRSYQRLILRVVLAVALVTAILCFSSTWPPAVNAEDPSLPRRDLQDSQEVLTASELPKEPVVAQESTLPQQTDDTKSSDQADSKEPTAIAEEPTPPQQKDDTKSSDKTDSKEQVSAISEKVWDTASSHIEALLGDEYRLKALLAPITETGEPLLRDLTHRVRAYGSVLKTWEELHLRESSGKFSSNGTLLSVRF
jgi:cytoskeletal protein RodZ